MLVYKTVSLVIIFLTGCLGGWFSFRMERSKRGASLMSLGNALSGGIFLGAGLLHMLPDAVSGFSVILPDVGFPVVFALCGAGFGLILLVERVLFTAHDDLESMSRTGGTTPYPYVLALVLSVHSIFAGVSLGVESSLIGSLAILIAIIAHKGSAAFALGVGMERGAIPRNRGWKVLVLFSLMTPLGVCLGSLFNALLSGNGEIGFEAVFDGLAAGTFLYVAVLDVINEEFEGRELRIPKYLLLVAGFSLMALLALWL